jgi:hypothetical protein
MFSFQNEKSRTNDSESTLKIEIGEGSDWGIKSEGKGTRSIQYPGT